MQSEADKKEISLMRGKSFMRKTTTAFIVLFFVLLFCACNSTPKSLVGSWKTGGEGSLYDQYNILTFDEDGTGSLKAVVPESEDTPEIISTSTLVYTLEDNTITIEYTSDSGKKTTTEQTFKIEGDTLTLESQRLGKVVYTRTSE